MNKVKPRQVAGWILQIFGLVLLYIAFFTDIGHELGPRFKVVFVFLGIAFFAYGRIFYLPDVKLLKDCPKCGREIKITNRICPYCKSDLHVTTRFPGVGKG